MCHFSFRILTWMAMAGAVGLVCIGSPAAHAAFIDVIANHGGAGDTVINSTNNAGTDDTAPFAPESAGRDEDHLIEQGNLSGAPLSQAASTSGSGNYWNSSNGASGNLGLLIDLGAVYRLDAMQMYSYNITDSGGSFTGRTPSSFTIWTASDDGAVTTTGGTLLVDDLGQFVQRGGTQSFSNPGDVATLGESYLFGGASQPSEVGGTTHNVTGGNVDARYVFIRDLTATSGTNVGLGEVNFYGAFPPPTIPEPSSLALLGLGVLGLLRHAPRRRRRNG